MNFLKDSRRCATEDVSPVERNAEHVSPSGAYPALLILRLPRQHKYFGCVLHSHTRSASARGMDSHQIKRMAWIVSALRLTPTQLKWSTSGISWRGKGSEFEGHSHQLMSTCT